MVSANIVIGLLNNVALLLAMGLIYDILYTPRDPAGNILYKATSGIILGIIAVVIMSTPVKWEAGVIFDTRSILLGLTGLYFGLVPTVITVAIAAAYRIYLGGGGMMAGVATIFTASIIGLLWRRCRGQRTDEFSLGELYLLGIVVHGGMILCMLLLPPEAMSRFFDTLAIPVISIYPIGTALLGGLLSSRQKRISTQENVRLLLDSTAEGIYGIDLEGKCTFCNSACVKILGFNDSHEILGKDMHQLIHHSRRDGACFPVEECRIFQAFRNGERVHVDDEVLWRADGTSFIAEYWSHPQVSDGRVIGAVVTFLDITERREAEETLKKSKNMLQEVVAAVPQHVFWKDRESRYLGCNNLFATAAGLKHPEDIIGKTDHDLPWPPEEADAYRADDRFVMEQNQPKRHIIEPLLQADGSRIWIDTTKVPLTDGQGSVYGVLGVYEDVTERLQSEESLRESNERFSTAFNCAPVMMTISVFETGAYLDVNQVFLEVTGFSREEVIGRTSVELGWITEADRTRLKEQLVRDGSIRDMELVLYAKNRRTVLCKYWGEIINSGGQRQLLSIALDVTEHRNVEQQLLQAQKMESVGRLAGGVAHDFNNMLGVILGHAEMGLIRLDPAHPVAANLSEISKAAERSADLTRQLLAFASKQTIAPKPLDLNEVIAGMLKMLQRLIGEDIHIVWQPAPDLWKVRVDPSQIDQILANLFVNARDAIADVGTVTISTENVAVDQEHGNRVDCVPGNYVKLTVNDNGSGMDRETVAHIFEPFFTTKEAGKGTGMGLATVFGAVTQNKGFIEVDSVLGQGTTFSIHLPRYAGEVRQMPSPEEAAPIPNGHETILLVEDEPTILEMAATMLEELGYVVLKAGSPGDAILLAQNHGGGIDLLLTDVVMPGMNGRSLAAAILPVHPSIKQLFMSGYTADVIAPRGVLEEGVHYIQKPFALAALAAKVREVLNT